MSNSIDFFVNLHHQFCKKAFYLILLEIKYMHQPIQKFNIIRTWTRIITELFGSMFWTIISCFYFGTKNMRESIEKNARVYIWNISTSIHVPFSKYTGMKGKAYQCISDRGGRVQILLHTRSHNRPSFYF